ncbi:MAG: protoheme farnesyltransferase [Flavipsychrobacter sp.]|nr:protoheme farnesyltransferase [Flavipsychrobacter sp.]
MLREQPMEAKWHLMALSRFRDYNQLLKPNLSGMVVFSSVIGYLMVPGIHFAWGDIMLWRNIITLFIGGMLVTGGANTINQILERDSDQLMQRTRLRPMPDGRMHHMEAWVFAAITGIGGALLLGYYFNPQTGALSFLSLLLYAFVYTPMKKVHPIAVFIGAIPGALPPLIGWVAGTGGFGIGGWILFTLQFFWQFPHFWAIAWVAFDDYNRAGIRLLPTRERETKFTAIQCVLYSLVLIPMATVPHVFGLIGNVGMVVCMLCGLMYFIASVLFYIKNDHKSARRVMFASFIYLPVILLALVMDKV